MVIHVKVTIEVTDFSSFKNTTTIKGILKKEHAYTNESIMKIITEVMKAIEPYIEQKQYGDK